MEKTEIKKILKFYKNLNPSTQLNINDREVIEVWCDVFMEYSYEQVRNAIVAFSKKKPFAPSIGEIISNIEVPDYTIELIEPYTVIVSFEDEEYGNFPFRFFNSQEAKKNIEKFGWRVVATKLKLSKQNIHVIIKDTVKIEMNYIK